MNGMKLVNDYPLVNVIDTNDDEAMRHWVDTLGESWVRLNLVTDTLGHTVGASGSSSDLSGGADRAVLSALREVADVVVIGGETVRREPDAVPRSRPVVVVSKSGDVPFTAIQRARGGMTVLHSASVSSPAGTTGIALPRFSGAAIVRAVRSLGHSAILCEGGATIATTLLKARVVDEVCLTISPRVGDPHGPALGSVEGTTVSIAHDDDGFRYVRRRPDGAPRHA